MSGKNLNNVKHLGNGLGVGAVCVTLFGSLQAAPHETSRKVPTSGTSTGATAKAQLESKLQTKAAGTRATKPPDSLSLARHRYELAADYSKDNNGLALLVMQNGKIVFEQYHNGHSADKPHRLASGTKSFWGIMAAAAIQDGLLSLDERASDTITEWRGHPAKSLITVRQLLDLSSGLVAGKRVLDSAPDKYNRALQMPLWSPPGTKFQYGPANYYVFGELMRRKLASRDETPLQYLERRVFKPIGLKYTQWSHDAAGNAHLPNGASLTAREWAKFGVLVKNGGAWNGTQLIPRRLVTQCLQQSKANPAYGLTFWLNVPAPSGVADSRIADGEPEPEVGISANTGGRLEARAGAQPFLSGELLLMRGGSIYSAGPRDLVMAAGASQQRLYIIPSLDLVIVRQGEDSRFRDSEFLARLLHGRTS